MATTTSRSHTTVKRELARAIEGRRDDCLPIEAARQLLSYDLPEHGLVGLRYDAERVVYYDEGRGTAFACPFSDVGPDGDRGVGIATVRSPVTVEAWVGKMEPYWAWVHPRYR